MSRADSRHGPERPAADTQRPPDVHVAVRGPVSQRERARMEERLTALLRMAPRPPRTAHALLRLETNPSRRRPAVAEAEVALAAGHFRAHVAAPSMRQAIHLVDGRLRRQIREAGERSRAARRGVREVVSDAGAPTHAGPRAVGDLHPWEAAAALADLHHDFFLFRHAGTGRDALVRAEPDGGYELVLDAPVMTPAEAEAHLEAAARGHVLYTNPDTGRLNVLYCRHDGERGVLAPWSDEVASDTGN